MVNYNLQISIKPLFFVLIIHYGADYRKDQGYDDECHTGDKATQRHAATLFGGGLAT